MGWGGLWQNVLRKTSSIIYPGGYWEKYSQDARSDATFLDFSSQDLEESLRIHQDHAGFLDIRSITWFLPEFKHPYYGGIFTILRFADYMKRVKGVDSRFAVLGSMDETQAARLIADSFPALSDGRVQSFDLYENVYDFDPSDAAIATLWSTAYPMLHFNQTKRKFYFIQDYEPLFYPAGSISAQVEATYSFGYYGIANTPTIKEIYHDKYGGKAKYFLPCVDTNVFHPAAENTHHLKEQMTIFFYGRPKHPRNGFELGAQAFRILKKRMGEKIRIIAAGDNWHPQEYDLTGIVENLGLLDYEDTAELYRGCDVGMIVMFTRHPSYLPFELMASGCLVVSNFNPATAWFLKDMENCMLSRASATSLAETLEEALLKNQERKRITANATRLIREEFSDWDHQIESIYQYMCDPNLDTQAN